MTTRQKIEGWIQEKIEALRSKGVTRRCKQRIDTHEFQGFANNRMLDIVNRLYSGVGAGLGGLSTQRFA